MIYKLLRRFFALLRVSVRVSKSSSFSIGYDSYIESWAFFSSERNIKIGSRTYVGRNLSMPSHFNIADEVLIASDDSSPINSGEIFEVARVSIEAAMQLRTQV